MLLGVPQLWNVLRLGEGLGVHLGLEHSPRPKAIEADLATKRRWRCRSEGAGVILLPSHCPRFRARSKRTKRLRAALWAGRSPSSSALDPL